VKTGCGRPVELALAHQVLGLARKGNLLFDLAADVQTIVDPKDAAESAGLHSSPGLGPVAPCSMRLARRHVRAMRSASSSTRDVTGTEKGPFSADLFQFCLTNLML
jgi:hypothetical protein